MAMDGHTYERSAIEAFFRHQRQHGQLITSPMSRRVLDSERLLPNRALKAVIEARKRMQTNVKLPQPPSRHNSTVSFVSALSISRDLSFAAATPAMDCEDDELAAPAAAPPIAATPLAFGGAPAPPSVAASRQPSTTPAMSAAALPVLPVFRSNSLPANDSSAVEQSTFSTSEGETSRDEQLLAPPRPRRIRTEPPVGQSPFGGFSGSAVGLPPRRLPSNSTARRGGIAPELHVNNFENEADGE